MVELTQNPESAEAAWPDVTYRGVSIVMDIYDAIEKETRKKLRKSVGSFQECYLGYNAKDDTFVIGYDIWDQATISEEIGGAYFHVQVGVNEKALTVQVKEFYHRLNHPSKKKGLFYQQEYEEVHRVFPKILDLRLD